MKFHYGSDLHLEFSRGTFVVPEGDVLLLAGDIFVPWFGSMDNLSKSQKAKFQKRFRKFFDECAAKNKHTFLVMGNHEHYHGVFLHTEEKVRNFLSPYSSVHLLQNEHYELENAMVFGSTFWTDMNGDNPMVSLAAQRGMSDFQLIQYSPETVSIYGGGSNMLHPAHTVRENQLARNQLFEFLTLAEAAEKLPVIMTHHAPTWESIKPHYRHDLMSYAYANMGLEYKLDAAPAFVWVHGHVHDPVHYTLANGVVLCNPRGYVSKPPQQEAFTFKTFDVTLGAEPDPT